MVLYSTTLLCRCFLRFLLARIVRASRPAAHRARGCWRWSPRWRAGGWPESTRDQMSRDTVLARTTPVANPAPLGAPLNSSLTVSFLVRLPSELCRPPGKSQDATTRPQNQVRHGPYGGPKTINSSHPQYHDGQMRMMWRTGRPGATGSELVLAQFP